MKGVVERKGAGGIGVGMAADLRAGHQTAAEDEQGSSENEAVHGEEDEAVVADPLQEPLDDAKRDISQRTAVRERRIHGRGCHREYRRSAVCLKPGQPAHSRLEP